MYGISIQSEPYWNSIRCLLDRYTLPLLCCSFNNISQYWTKIGRRQGVRAHSDHVHTIRARLYSENHCWLALLIVQLVSHKQKCYLCLILSSVFIKCTLRTNPCLTFYFYRLKKYIYAYSFVPQEAAVVFNSGKYPLS